MFAKSYFAVFAVMCLTAAQAAVIAGPQRKNNYNRPNPNSIESNNIEDNMIVLEYDTVDGIVPPKISSQDYYDYNQKPIEEEEMQKLSAAFAQLAENGAVADAESVDEDEVEPSVAVSESVAASESEAPAEVEEEPVVQSKTVEVSEKVELNATESVSSTTEKVAVNSTEVEDDEDLSWSLDGIVDSIWGMMKSALNYVNSLFGRVFSNDNEKTSELNRTVEEVSTKAASLPTPSPTTTVAVFALEEPTSYHRLPSEEFEKRGRDIDSLLYGYGIA